MSTKTLTSGEPDDDGDSKEKLRKLLEKKAALEKELEHLEEQQRELTAAQIIKGYIKPANQ
jgi:hypothetical protein